MIKRMLIDATTPEETRMVVVNGNKLEDVECETAYRRQIKGNIYLAKVMRVEPSLQAAFVDYGGNKHGFLAFGEIHPDYYQISEQEMAEIDKEVEDIVEGKKNAIKERELERERIRAEKAQARQEAEKLKAEQENSSPAQTQDNVQADVESDATDEAENATEANGEASDKPKRQRFRRRPRRNRKYSGKNDEELKVLSENSGMEEESVREEVSRPMNDEDDYESMSGGSDSEAFDDDDDDQEYDFDLQKKLLKARKLYHRHSIQEVIKEGQILIVQIVKEERGNKGAALTTYLSLAGRYSVLMPNRIKSGGVSRKITNVADRKRLKGIVKELPLTSDMSIIVRTAGEEKTKADIVRDYNYLIRSWNQIRINSLSSKAPAMIHEEGNLIKRALRDIYTKEVSEILVAGENAFKVAKDFFRILSPHNLKKIKLYRNNDMPLFQRFQVETQLDKLHETVAQLDSGGYLVINPTEALVSIDVNSGRATKEKDLEETALKTNLEACDEVARQLRMRNLAGLVVIDFIDMDEQANNHAIERRMKEALKKDRSRVQVGKMSCFGLLELSRQRMHSSFFESNYTTCPYCGGKGLVRTIESSSTLVLRGIEEEGIRSRSAQINLFVPSEIAVYLLNHKREKLMELEKRYGMNVIISADNSIKNVSDYRIERVKIAKADEEEKKTPERDNRENTNNREERRETNSEERNEERRDDRRNNRRDDRNNRRDRRDNRNERRDNPRFQQNETPAPEKVDAQVEETAVAPQNIENSPVENKAPEGENNRNQENRRDRRGRDRRRGRGGRDGRDRDRRFDNRDDREKPAPVKERQEAIILYNSHGNAPAQNSAPKQASAQSADSDDAKEKTTWWKKLIKG